jgi:hypothetical protein
MNVSGIRLPRREVSRQRRAVRRLARRYTPSPFQYYRGFLWPKSGWDYECLYASARRCTSKDERRRVLWLCREGTLVWLRLRRAALDAGVPSYLAEQWILDELSDEARSELRGHFETTRAIVQKAVRAAKARADAAAAEARVRQDAADRERAAAGRASLRALDARLAADGEVRESLPDLAMRDLGEDLELRAFRASTLARLTRGAGQAVVQPSGARHARRLPRRAAGNYGDRRVDVTLTNAA